MDDHDRDERRAAAAVSILALGLVSATAYVVQRAIEHVVASGDVNVLLRSAVVSFYWRCATATFWGGLVAIGIWLLVRPGERRLGPSAVASKLGAAAVPLAVVLLLLSLWLP